MPILLSDAVFVVTTNQRYQKIAKADILYLQAEGSWVDIITLDKTYRLATNIGQLEPQLDTTWFGRVSRRHIVNLHRVEAVQGRQLFVQGVALLIGKQSRELILKQLPILKTKI